MRCGVAALAAVYVWCRVAVRPLLLEKGLGNKHRVYEMLGASHFEARHRRAGRAESSDLGGS